jgi:hypothetical protein
VKTLNENIRQRNIFKLAFEGECLWGGAGISVK